MFPALGIDAFTALALMYFGGIIAVIMALVQLVLQVAHRKDGFRWKEAVYPSLAVSLTFAFLVGMGDALESVPLRISLSHALAVGSVLLPATLCGSLLGRVAGWLIGKMIAFLNAE